VIGRRNGSPADTGCETGTDSLNGSDCEMSAYSFNFMEKTTMDRVDVTNVSSFSPTIDNGSRDKMYIFNESEITRRGLYVGPEFHAS